MVTLLASMQQAAHMFVEGMAQSMAREGAADIGSLPAAVYAPFQPQLDRWADNLVLFAPIPFKQEATVLRAPADTI